jgi:hypothetical protein
MNKFTRPLCVVAVLTLALAPQALAAVIVTNNAEAAPAPGGESFTPSYAVSSTDLINGLLPTDSAGDFTVEIAGGLPVLTDGAYGTITQPGGAPDRTHGAFATVGGGGGTGTFVTYTLDIDANPLGFDITSINAYSGWNDSGRDQQLFAVSYSTVADPATFLDLAQGNFNPTVPADTQSATRVTVADDALAALASGVGMVRFDFTGPPAPENGYVGYAELDVIGTPTVPEPATAGLLCAGALALLARRRR